MTAGRHLATCVDEVRTTPERRDAGEECDSCMSTFFGDQHPDQFGVPGVVPVPRDGRLLRAREVHRRRTVAQAAERRGIPARHEAVRLRPRAQRRRRARRPSSSRRSSSTPSARSSSASSSRKSGSPRRSTICTSCAFRSKAFAEMTELQWFLTEQVEEEKTAREIVAQVPAGRRRCRVAARPGSRAGHSVGGQRLQAALNARRLLREDLRLRGDVFPKFVRHVVEPRGRQA